MHEMEASATHFLSATDDAQAQKEVLPFLMDGGRAPSFQSNTNCRRV